ncbi:MAG: Gfo/Idh/MocA family oxidoreductase [Chitinophagaceae bacterium]|nr:MAG: Gfo/Idh/MocA family oxidoreductase [Chitinophagaceae bacterium]
MKKKQTSGSSRRKFLQTSSLAAAGFFIVPRHVLGRGHVAPSDKLNIAGIGVGGKGWSDLSEFAKSPNVNIVGLADVDDRQAEKAVKKWPKAKHYRDYREMLEKESKNFDACSISTPDNVHAVATTAAMALGKHVYTQKPLTHDIYEARMVTEAAKKYKVVTQMGNQGGSGDGVRLAKEMIDAGMIGDIFKVECWTNRPVWPQGNPTPTGNFDVPKELDWNLWQGPAKAIPFNPNYLPFNWRGWWAYGTGALGDMACHIMDPVFRCLPIDYPTSVEASVATIWREMWNDSVNLDSAPASSMIHLTYPRKDGKGDVKVTWMDGGLLPQRPDEMLPDEQMGNWDGGVIFHGEKGKLMADCYGANPRLLPTAKMKTVTLPKQTIKRVPEGHYLQWVNACIAGYGKGETSSPFEYAGPFTESILIGNLAIRSFFLKNANGKGWDDKYLGRKKLLWDSKNMKITNFDEANAFVRRDYREGWKMTS